MAHCLASTQLSCFCLVSVQNKSANIDPHASRSAFLLASGHTTVLAVTDTPSASSAKAPSFSGDFAGGDLRQLQSG